MRTRRLSLLEGSDGHVAAARAQMPHRHRPGDVPFFVTHAMNHTRASTLMKLETALGSKRQSGCEDLQNPRNATC